MIHQEHRRRSAKTFSATTHAARSLTATLRSVKVLDPFFEARIKPRAAERKN